MGLHWYDLAVLVVLGLIIFGPKKLPEMGSSLGKTIREFQKSMREVTNPEPPTAVPPSATQAAQPLAAPAPTEAPAETTPVMAASQAPAQATVSGQIVEEGGATRIEEDSIR
jgi:sec-independent protein translocase protein TatA